jgi:hypothetical protein
MAFLKWKIIYYSVTAITIYAEQKGLVGVHQKVWASYFINLKEYNSFKNESQATEETSARNCRP